MYFPINAEEDYIERPARRDALAILRDARDRCGEQDMRTPDVLAALDYLAGRIVTSWPIGAFRDGLDTEHPIGRAQSVNAALNAIERNLPRRQGR